MIIESGKKLNRSSWSSFIGAGEFVLAILLYFYPDWAKIFLFVLPVAVMFAEGAEQIFKYFRNRNGIIKLLTGIICCGAGTALLFFGRKTFMVGVAVLMFMEIFRQFSGAGSDRAGKIEKMVWYSAALLSLIWMLLIIFKGLHLYWSVREYLAFYFFGSAVLSLLRRK